VAEKLGEVLLRLFVVDAHLGALVVHPAALQPGEEVEEVFAALQWFAYFQCPDDTDIVAGVGGGGVSEPPLKF